MDESSSDRITTPEMLEAILTTLSNARAEGEPYSGPTEEHLGPIEAIVLHIARERHDVDTALKREETEMDKFDRQIEASIHGHADLIWDQLGCPDYDPIFNILFPPAVPPSAAPSAHMDNAHRERAERLLVMADMLNCGLHPKIDRAVASRIAQEIRALADRYNEHAYARSKHQIRKNALNALEASVARIGLLQLGTLRRALRAVGVDDTHIRTVVPAPVSSRRFPTR
jgi:hypothetical protein